VTVLSTGTSMITSAPAPTAAAPQNAGQPNRADPLPASSRARPIPASPPAAALSTHNGAASTAVSRTSCHRVAPRATSIADSPSRCPASSRATASRAAAASRNSSTAQMASSERATSRLFAVPLSTAGRPVVMVTSGRSSASASPSRSPLTLAATVLSRPAGMSAVRGTTTQDPASTVSGPLNAAAVTVSGP
jgi:hypothetical protein